MALLKYRKKTVDDDNPEITVINKNGSKNE